VHLGIKAKQIVGVTLIVGIAVVGLSLLHVTLFARVLLQESGARAKVLADTIFQRAKDVVPNQADPWAAVRADGGLRDIVDSGVYFKSVLYAAICNVDDVAVVAWDSSREGKRLPPGGDFDALLALNGPQVLMRIYSSASETFEVRVPLLLGGDRFGSIRIGLSNIFVRQEVSKELWLVGASGLVALLVAIVVSASFAQLILRPIHVIRSGLTRLGKGEFGVRLDLPQQDEFGELGSFFNTVSAQLSADRTELAGQKANLQSAVEHMEDEVAIFSPAGELVFANTAMLATLPADPFGRPVDDLLPGDHPYRDLVRAAIGGRQTSGPVSATIPGLSGGPAASLPDGRQASPPEPGGSAPAGGDPVDRLLTAHAIKDRDGQLLGIMLVARDLQALGRVESMLNYSRKLVALGRLSAGVAHEVKNPLNAMTIHLELLKQKLLAASGAARRPAGAAGGVSVAAAVDDAPRPEVSGALDHARIIAGEIQRLDQVMQGFLKFTRSEELKLQPISLPTLVNDVVRVVEPECAKAGVHVITDGLDRVPEISGDPEMLRQAFLNLALNAIQAMPNGGTLRITATAARGRRVQVRIEDNGVGIKPEHLERIFDLYFTTREKGSGIGLSMVYRTVQLHDGEIEVESTEGRGTTFRLALPEASARPAAQSLS
jgi:signal transduction histidine kinase